MTEGAIGAVFLNCVSPASTLIKQFRVNHLAALRRPIAVWQFGRPDSLWVLVAPPGRTFAVLRVASVKVPKWSAGDARRLVSRCSLRDCMFAVGQKAWILAVGEAHARWLHRNTRLCTNLQRRQPANSSAW